MPIQHKTAVVALAALISVSLALPGAVSAQGTVKNEPKTAITTAENVLPADAAQQAPKTRKKPVKAKKPVSIVKLFAALFGKDKE